MYKSYKKIKNVNPKTRFLTPKGWRTPKEVWTNTESGFNFRGMTRKSVIEHEKMMGSLGITPNMTNDETVEHLQNSHEKLA